MKRGSSRWRRLRRVVRLIALALLAVLGLVAVVLAIVLVPTIPDPTTDLDRRRGTIETVDVTRADTTSDATIREITLTTSTGLEVDFSVRVPIDNAEPAPTIILLAGQGTGRDAVRFLADTRGVVVAALSYPYRGADDASTFRRVIDLPRIQRAIRDTAPSVLVVADWLVAQPFVDRERLELAGGSLGAFFVGVPGALDPRFRRVWLVHGAGDPPAVIAHGLRNRVPSPAARRWLARFLAAAAGSRHLAPEKWVGRIAPREVVVISARDDAAFPRECVEVLHGSLRQPYDIIWMSGGHVRPSRGDVIRRITDLVFERMTTPHGSPPREPASPPTPPKRPRGEGAGRPV